MIPDLEGCSGMASRELTPTQTKAVLGVVVVIMAGGGIAWSLGLWEGNEERPPRTEPSPSPIATSFPDAAAVEEWFPFSLDEFAAGGDVAQQFAARYATADYRADPDALEYTDRLTALATEEYAERLEEGSGAASMRADLAESEISTQGRAQVTEVSRFSDTSVTFLVDVQTITTDATGAGAELGEYSITVVREDGAWRVYDFMPAGIGQAGDPDGTR